MNGTLCKWIGGSLLLLVWLAGGSGCATPGTAHIMLGSRSLNHEWDPVDQQTAGGFTIGLQPQPHSPLEVEFGMLSGTDEEDVGLGLTARSTVSEFFVGLRGTAHFHEMSNFKPYIGGGLLYASATVGVEDDFDNNTSETDGSGGAYVHAGIYFDFGGGRSSGNSFNLGFDFRRTLGTQLDGDLRGFDDVDSTMFSIVLGWHWSGAGRGW
jgi:hypothetical protein